MKHGIFSILGTTLAAAALAVSTTAASAAELRVLTHSSFTVPKPLLAQFEKDADVNKPGWAPLHYAASYSQLEVMHLLIEHSAYLDAASPNGTTPLMMAAKYGNASAVKLLLEAGADPTVKNELALTALDFADQAQRFDSAAIISAFIRGRQPKGSW